MTKKNKKIALVIVAVLVFIFRKPLMSIVDKIKEKFPKA